MSAATFVLLVAVRAVAVGSMVGPTQQSLDLIAGSLLGAVVPCLLLVPAAWWSRTRPARRRVGWYVVAAVASALAVRTVGVISELVALQHIAGWYLESLATSTALGLLPPIVTAWTAAALVVGVVERRRAGAPWSRHAVARSAEIVGLGLGLMLVVALALQWLGAVYLPYAFGEQSYLTPADSMLYLATASTCLVLVVIGIVAAWRAGHRRTLLLGVVVLAVAVVAAAVFAVPTGRWTDGLTPLYPRRRDGLDSRLPVRAPVERSVRRSPHVEAARGLGWRTLGRPP